MSVVLPIHLLLDVTYTIIQKVLQYNCQNTCLPFSGNTFLYRPFRRPICWLDPSPDAPWAGFLASVKLAFTDSCEVDLCWNLLWPLREVSSCLVLSSWKFWPWLNLGALWESSVGGFWLSERGTNWDCPLWLLSEVVATEGHSVDMPTLGTEATGGCGFTGADLSNDLALLCKKIDIIGLTDGGPIGYIDHVL